MIVSSSKAFGLTKSFPLILACPAQRARVQQPLLGVSLAATYEDWLSSLHQAAAHVRIPTGETEVVSHNYQSERALWKELQPFTTVHFFSVHPALHTHNDAVSCFAQCP